MATVPSNKAATAAGTIPRFLRALRPVHMRVQLTDQEQGSPLQNMQPASESGEGLRLRQTSGNPQNQEASYSTSGTLIPDSSAASPTSQGRSSSWRSSREGILSRVESTLFGLNAEEVQQRDRNRGHDQFIDKKVDDFPRGFPQLSAMIACDSDLMIFRGFKYIHCRLLLHLEVEMTELEKELFALDKSDAKSPITVDRLKKTGFEEGGDRTQSDLLHRIWIKTIEYDELFIKFNQMQALGKPPARIHRSLFNWIWSGSGPEGRKRRPLMKGYYDFIFHSEDFLSVTPSESNYFEDAILSHAYNNPNSWLKKLFKTSQEDKKTSNEKVNQYSSKRLAIASKMMLVLLAVGLIMAPVFVLFLKPMSRGGMAVTALGFISLCGLVLSTMTRAKDHEVIFGTAGYGAVLMVFLGTVSQYSLVGGGM